jgi:hypothetical protein
MKKLKILTLVISCWFSALCLEPQCMDDRADILEKDGGEQKKIFCCGGVIPYKPRRTDHEDLFNSFKAFSSGTGKSLVLNEDTRSIQIIKQQNFGPILEKRYFVLPDFQEVTEDYFIECNYKRLNSFKNYKCATHNLFFELNAYIKNSEIRSNHHQSTTSGNVYSRDSKIIDFESVPNKGIL